MKQRWRDIVASKQAMRRKLAALPVAEKLRLLETLRERTATLAGVRKRLAEARAAKSALPAREK